MYAGFALFAAGAFFLLLIEATDLIALDGIKRPAIFGDGEP